MIDQLRAGPAAELLGLRATSLLPESESVSIRQYFNPPRLEEPLLPSSAKTSGEQEQALASTETPATPGEHPGLIQTVTRYRLALIREEETPYKETRLGTPGLVARFLGAQLADRPQEAMCAVYLDTRNDLIGWQIAYLGTINRAAVEPRALLQMALLTNAVGMILGHNHPSGDPSPSAEDLTLTKRVEEAGAIVGIRLIDHLVLGAGSRWVSLRQRGGW